MGRKRWYSLLAILFLIALLAFVLVNCGFITWKYRLQQPIENAVAIKIMERTYEDDRFSTSKVVRELSLDEGKKMIDDLLQLECGYSQINPHQYFSHYFVEITYQNGMREMIGQKNNGWITGNGRMHYGHYYFVGDAFFSVLYMYL